MTVASCQDSMCQRRLDRAVLQAQHYRREVERLRVSLERIVFITGGIDTPSTSNAAHYEAAQALANGATQDQEKKA